MRKRDKIAITLAVATATVGLAAPARADDTNVTVTGASLALGSITTGDFGGVTLNGAAQTTTGTMSAFSVTDSRGTGVGWNVTVSASAFKEYASGSYVEGGRTLGTSRFTMGQASAAKSDSSSSGLPTMTSGTYTLDADTNADGTSEAVKIASAATGDGMGAYSVTPGQLSLSIPASAYAKTYRSDVTVTLSTGP
ncbi:MAG: WxL domain-containing protein [Actinomycetota bacterium]|nr:WxL domain-containing protein [Actinomycetota bacterium]